MEQLFFDNPSMREGLNLTVRNGWKWARHNNTYVYLTDGNTGEVVDSVLINTVTLTFKDIPNWVLEFEHDENCRTKNGLYEAMIDIYGQSFDVNSAVTLVFFWMNA